jgi:hypothetical protein
MLPIMYFVLGTKVIQGRPNLGSANYSLINDRNTIIASSEKTGSNKISKSLKNYYLFSFKKQINAEL